MTYRYSGHCKYGWGCIYSHGKYATRPDWLPARVPVPPDPAPAQAAQGAGPAARHDGPPVGQAAQPPVHAAGFCGGVLPGPPAPQQLPARGAPRAPKVSTAVAELECPVAAGSSDGAHAEGRPEPGRERRGSESPPGSNAPPHDPTAPAPPGAPVPFSPVPLEPQERAADLGPASETAAGNSAGPPGADAAAPVDAPDPGEAEPEAGAADPCQVPSAGEQA